MTGLVAREPAIELRSLRKTYRKGKKTTVAVDGLDLVVPRGEVFGLLGHDPGVLGDPRRRNRAARRQSAAQARE